MSFCMRPIKTIGRKYMTEKKMRDPFPYPPGYHTSINIITRLRFGLIWCSRNDTRADMGKFMYQYVLITYLA